MIGKTIYQYQILEKLGEGGMGIVYKARDTKLNRDVALKFLTPNLTADEQAKNRFVREARAASSLDHPNISVIHEIGETDDGHSFICMGYYDGQTLKEKLEQDPPILADCIAIIKQIARGLQRAHEAGIIHRDIKPANIILTDQGDIKIVDFGLAKLVSETGITETGSRGGTLAYMSPEQLQGDKVDYLTDLYSLGILMYEIVSGKRPYHEEHYAALMYSIVNTDPPPPSVINRSIPKELDELILKLIHKDPDQRVQSAGEVVQILDNFLNRKSEPEKIPASATGRFISRPLFLLPALIALLSFTSLLLPFTRSSLSHYFNIAQTPEDIHLVVLPFINVGDDPDNKAFTDGLMETLTSSLTFIQPADISYWVVSASEVRRQNVTSATDALREFNATLAVYGSVHRLANQVRLTLNLVDTKTSRQIKSDMITLPLESLPILLDEAILTLAQMLEIKIGTDNGTFYLASVTANPDSYEYYVEGRGYLQDFQNIDNIHRAITLFDYAVEQDPAFALAYAGLGEAYWRLFDETRNTEWVDFAEKYANKALELENLHPSVLVTLGMIQLGRGNLAESITAYQKAVDLNPANAEAYRGLATAYEQHGHIGEAEEILKRAIRLQPTYWGGYNQLGSFYLNQGKFQDAILPYEKVIELIPNSSRGYSNLGVTYYFLNNIEKAIDMFNKMEEIEPSDYVYSNLATFYYYQSEFEKAAEMYRNALSFSDQDHRVWGYLASAQKWAGEDSSIVNKNFRKALNMAEEEKLVNPRNLTLLNSIAGYYAELGQNSVAKDLLFDVLDNSDDDFSIVGDAGRIFERLGERELALDLISKAIRNGYPVSEIKSDPNLSKFRSDPDFITFMEELNQHNRE